MQPPSSPSQEAGRALRVAILHPMRAWVDALEQLLGPRWDVTVVAAHTSADWVRHAVLTDPVDLLLVHFGGSSSGETLAMVRALTSARAGLGVVGLSESAERSLLCSAVGAGVRGWVEPTASGDHMVRVMHGVADGETWFPPRLMTPVLDTLLEVNQRREQAASVMAALSSREVEVLECLAQGLTRQQIAERFFLSPHPVRTHINNVLRKLGVHSTLAAVSIARQVGLDRVTG